MKFKVPLSATAGDLADGRPFGPGDIVRLDEKAAKLPHNQRLIAEGLLLRMPEKTATPKGARKESDR